MRNKKQIDSALAEVKSIVNSKASRAEKLLMICTVLKGIGGYDWVGVYLADETERELALGPYIGEPTEHPRIRFGSGICGQAAERKETFVVEDVSEEKNNLACSPKVKSEIVLPILKDGLLAAELDIDSHTIARFGQEDRKFLERVCGMLAELF